MEDRATVRNWPSSPLAATDTSVLEERVSTQVLTRCSDVPEVVFQQTQRSGREHRALSKVINIMIDQVVNILEWQLDIQVSDP